MTNRWYLTRQSCIICCDTVFRSTNWVFGSVDCWKTSKGSSTTV